METILAVNPDDAYDVIALNAASASTMISGLPFEGPVSGVRLALIDGQWVAFPRWSERERAVFEIVVAGRVVDNGDVAIAMIEAGAGKNAWDPDLRRGPDQAGRGGCGRWPGGCQAVHQGHLRGSGRAQAHRRQADQGGSSSSRSTPTSCTPASTRSLTLIWTRRCPLRRSCRVRTASPRSSSTSGCAGERVHRHGRGREGEGARQRVQGACSARSCAAAS